jgi:deazaflavin-dependent oxidoreductase (nitroreductase family)
MTTPARYLRPDWFTTNVLNRLVALLTGLGVSLGGSRVLAVKGRKSGQWRTTPVNLLAHEGHHYLVAPRGHTQWVHNLRAAGTGELRIGRRADFFKAIELRDDQKVPVIRAYLTKWGWETSAFFEGLKKDSPDAAIAEVAPGFPVFRIEVKGTRKGARPA